VTDTSFELGEIKGLLAGMKDDMQYLRAKTDGIDDRLRTVEKKAAINGAISGGIMSAGVATVIAVFKSSIGSA